jgi:enhancing lycopene biosynthesis protein 2
MKAIFLFGHMPTVTAAYRHVDAMLRKAHVHDIAIAMVVSVDEDTAQALRQAGGELWHCGPADAAADDHGGITPDRCLHAQSWHDLTAQAVAALEVFLGQTGVPA